ncbi:hypothetical protein PBI_COUNT_101 [Microbacterium phage Count]|nr:hypothetical protein PBI_COUNT_101 [Microbacterium phage Count]
MTEEVRTTSSTGAEKGMKEARHDLIPGPALDLLARLYGKGAEKYAAHNWRKGYEWSKSYAAAQRHMLLFWEGEDIDPEMGLPHVTCAAFHMFALATYMIEHPEFDDRFKKEVSSFIQNIPIPEGTIIATEHLANPEPFGEKMVEPDIPNLADQVENLADDPRMNDLQKVALKAVAETIRKDFCNECQGPYSGWLEEQYGGHWDSCPNRHKFEKKSD